MNRIALITGSGRPRVGYVVARHLAKHGFDIAVHYHTSADSAQSNVDELRSLGVQSESYQADVTNEEEVKSLIGKVVDRFGSLDVLVITSSIWKSKSLEEVTAADVTASFQVNTLGTFLCCQHAGLHMVTQSSGGSIVTIGDSLIQHPYKDHAAYFAAKGAIPTLTRAFAVELAHRNPDVRVNCIEPGPIMLPKDMSEAEREERVNSTLVKHADDPETVAKTVEFFIGNPMLTGQCIQLDGGHNVGLEHRARGQQ